MQTKGEIMKPVEESRILNFLRKILLFEKCFALLFRRRKKDLPPHAAYYKMNSKEDKCCDCATD